MKQFLRQMPHAFAIRSTIRAYLLKSRSTYWGWHRLWFWDDSLTEVDSEFETDSEANTDASETDSEFDTDCDSEIEVLTKLTLKADETEAITDQWLRYTCWYWRLAECSTKLMLLSTWRFQSTQGCWCKLTQMRSLILTWGWRRNYSDVIADSDTDSETDVLTDSWWYLLMQTRD